jgi:hypothetical protein
VTDTSDDLINARSKHLRSFDIAPLNPMAHRIDEHHACINIVKQYTL